MPSIDRGTGATILTGKRRKITTEDWIKLIEFRMALIKPFLDKITLQPFGNTNISLHCPGVENLYDLGTASRKIPAMANLDIRGFFKLIGKADINGDITLVFLGLNRQAQLMEIRINVKKIEREYIITELLADRPEITAQWFEESILHPRILFLHLGRFFEGAMNERERLYKEMKEVYETMEFEKNLMSFVSG